MLFGIYQNQDPYVRIEEYSTATAIPGGYTYDIRVNQDYQNPRLDRVELVLLKYAEQSQYGYVCFRDNGTKINDAFIKDLSIRIDYSGIEKTVANISNRDYSFLQEQCFHIIDRTNITWNWIFSSNIEFTKAFLNHPNAEGTVFSPNLVTYLKKGGLTYYIIVIFICFFISGLFLYSLTRINSFIFEGFKGSRKTTYVWMDRLLFIIYIIILFGVGWILILFF